jgi:hypothetical protein
MGSGFCITMLFSADKANRVSTPSEFIRYPDGNTPYR